MTADALLTEPSDRSSAPPGAALSRSHLGVRIADRQCLIELALAGELLQVPDRIVPIPLARPWLMGVFSLRGQLMSLVDLARYRGWGQSAPGKAARVLALAPSLRFNAAILVDEVYGLHDPSDASSQWTTIDCQALVHEPAFLMASRLSPAGWVQTESPETAQTAPSGPVGPNPSSPVQP